MSRWLISVSLAVLSWPAGPAAAQSTSFHGPLSGFVYSHDSRTVRPLLGVSGSAQIGSPVLNEVDFASIGPDAKWALINKAGHSSVLNGMSDLAPAESSVSGLIDAVDRVLWNRDGSFALLYSSSTNLLQRVRFSDSAAAADSPLDLTPWGTASTLAIDPAGQRIAFGVTGSGLYVFGSGQSPVLLSSMAQPAATAFDSNGRLYAADLDQQQISEFDPGSGSQGLTSLAQPDMPSITPVGMAVSGDNRYLLLADSAAHAVRVYDTASGSLVNTIPLDFIPSRFEALSSAPTYLLNGDNSSEWLLVLDARQLPGISFVPANPQEAQ